MSKHCESCGEELAPEIEALYESVPGGNLKYGILCEDCLEEQSSVDEIMAEWDRKMATRMAPNEYTIRVGISTNSESGKIESVKRMLEAHPHVTTVTIE